jgi:hypothetical protein
VCPPTPVTSLMYLPNELTQSKFFKNCCFWISNFSKKRVFIFHELPIKHSYTARNLFLFLSSVGKRGSNCNENYPHTQTHSARIFSSSSPKVPRRRGRRSLGVVRSLTIRYFYSIFSRAGLTSCSSFLIRQGCNLRARDFSAIFIKVHKFFWNFMNFHDIISIFRG